MDDGRISGEVLEDRLREKREDDSDHRTSPRLRAADRGTGLRMPALSPQAAYAKLDGQLIAIEREAAKELKKMLRDVGNEARDAIRGGSEDPHKTGTLRRSVKTSVRGQGVVSLYSNLPQAAVWEFGGAIKPRGVAIQIPRTRFVGGTVEELGDHIDERLGDAFDAIAHQHGFLG